MTSIHYNPGDRRRNGKPVMACGRLSEHATTDMLAVTCRSCIDSRVMCGPDAISARLKPEAKECTR